jgi:hypothetical protein
MAFLPEWRNLGYLASSVLIVLTLACGGGGGRDRTPSGSLEVFNDGTQAMNQLFVTPSGNPTWGVDQLAPSILLTGDALTLAPLDPDSYDVLAVFADGSSDEVQGVAVQDGLTTQLGMMNSGNGGVAVFNNAGLAITGVYLTLSSATTWGPNQTDVALDAGQTLTLTGITPATYDLRVIFSDGSHEDNRGFTVTSGTLVSIQEN